jgi:tRNA(fMet)-specific endonuclease VapC
VFKTGDRNELTKTARAIAGMTLLHGDAMTAIIYARIRRDLESAGSMIPQNDIWIAAASIQADVPLITRDRHFEHVRHLKLVKY